MARTLSKDKRDAILDAAAEFVATEGLAARTAQIAAAAKVAEGTIFKYFATKDALMNALYVALKAELFESLAAGFERHTDDPGRWQAIWDAYIDWGVENSLKRRALRQLRVSETITPESRKATMELSGPMTATLFRGEAEAGQPLSLAYTAAIFDALAEMTIDLIAAAPTAHKAYRQQGFASFWRAIGRA